MRRVPNRVAALAWGLILLQACGGGDVTSPPAARGWAPAVPGPAAPAPVVQRVETDTAEAGGVLVLAGERLPAQASLVRATLDGVPLPVKTVSATLVEFEVPTTFVCQGVVNARLAVQVGVATFAAAVPLRTAVRLDVQLGETRVLGGEAGRDACVELVATGAAKRARYVVAVVNTTPASHGGGAMPSYALRGEGTGALAGVTSVETEPAIAGAQRSAVGVEHTGPVEPRHDDVLAVQRTTVVNAGSAVAQWVAPSDSSARTGMVAVTARAATAASARTTAWQVGDTTTLSAMVGSCSRAPAVRARVVYAGSHALVLEDVAAPLAGRMDATYRQIGDEYDRVVHPLLETQVGNPLAMDATMGSGRPTSGRVVLLFTRVVNDSLAGTAGYVSACNFYPRGTFAASNEAAVVYGRVPAAHETPADWRRAMRATVVHEAKHLASFAERLVRGRDFEEPWLEEATARVAEELYARTFTPGAAWRGNTGFAVSVHCEVTMCDDRPLVMWKHFSGLHAWLQTAGSARVGQVSGEAGAALSGTAANAGYASGWALVRWVLDWFVTNERDVLRQLVAGGTAVGIPALATAAGIRVPELLAQWAVNVGADAGLGASESPLSLSSWRYSDIIGGMASLFPGVFSGQPLPAAHRSAGRFSLPPSTLTGTAHYLTVSGDLSAGGQLLHLVAGGELRLAVRRVR